MLKSKTITLKTLVRDNMVDIIEDGEITTTNKRLEGKEFVQALKQKIADTAKEIGETEHNAEIINELAELGELIDVLMIELQLDPEELFTASQQKRNTNGGYDDRVFLETVTVPENHPDFKQWEKLEK